MSSSAMPQSRWSHGLAFSILASAIGAASKLCIRRSYTILEDSKVLSAPRSEETAMLCTQAEASEENTAESDRSRQNCNNEEDVEETAGLNILSNQKEEYSSAVDEPLWLRKLRAFSLRVMGIFGQTVLGPSCNVYALQFASPSILCPIGSGLTLVWIVIFSGRTIGERPRPTQVLAVGFIVLGDIIISITGDHTNVEALRMDELRQQYKKPQFIVYFLCMSIWISILVFLINSSNSGWRRFAWGVIGGSVTGVQNFLKDTLAVFHGMERKHYPHQLYIMLSFAGMIPLTGLLLLIECIKRYDALYSASMFVGSLVISSSVMAAVHYHTFDNISRLGWVFYPIGLATILFGAAMLAVEGNIREQSNIHKEIDKEHSKLNTSTTRQLHYGGVEIGTHTP